MFKVGDVVKVKEDFMNIPDEFLCATKDMYKYAGSTRMVRGVDKLMNEEYYLLTQAEDSLHCWCFAEQWLELVEDINEINEIKETELMDMF